jgi:hypothetical protein
MTIHESGFRSPNAMGFCLGPSQYRNGRSLPRRPLLGSLVFMLESLSLRQTRHMEYFNLPGDVRLGHSARN